MSKGILLSDSKDYMQVHFRTLTKRPDLVIQTSKEYYGACIGVSGERQKYVIKALNVSMKLRR